MSAASDETLRIAQEFMAAFQRRDAATLLSMLHEEAVLEVAFPFLKGEGGMGNARQTGAAVRAYVEAFRRLSAEVHFSNSVWRTTSDGLALFQTDSVMRLANGKIYPNHYLFFFGVTDGKIAWWREYYNPVAAARGMGVPLDEMP